MRVIVGHNEQKSGKKLPEIEFTKRERFSFGKRPSVFVLL